MFIVREHELCQSNFTVFSHGASLLDTWLTMPLELMLCPGTPGRVWRFQLETITDPSRGLYTPAEGAIVQRKYFDFERYTCGMAYLDRHYSTSLCWHLTTVMSKFELRLARPIKDTYCPFRLFESTVVALYPHACDVMSSTTLLGEAIRLRDQAMVREARDEILADAERAASFYV